MPAPLPPRISMVPRDSVIVGSVLRPCLLVALQHKWCLSLPENCSRQRMQSKSICISYHVAETSFAICKRCTSNGQCRKRSLTCSCAFHNHTTKKKHSTQEPDGLYPAQKFCGPVRKRVFSPTHPYACLPMPHMACRSILQRYPGMKLRGVVLLSPRNYHAA